MKLYQTPKSGSIGNRGRHREKKTYQRTKLWELISDRIGTQSERHQVKPRKTSWRREKTTTDVSNKMKIEN